MKEVIIGTSEEPLWDQGRSLVDIEKPPTGAHIGGDEEHLFEVDEVEEVQPPPIADVEIHLSRVRQTILLASSPSVDGLAFPNAEISGDEIERVDLLCDLLDTVFFWAVEEGSTFLEEPSQLSQVDVPEVVVFGLLSQRARVVQKSLEICEVMLKHIQSASELHRLSKAYVSFYYKEQQSKGASFFDKADPMLDDPDCISPLLFIILYLMRRFEGLPDLIATAIRVATVLALQDGTERVLRSDLISLILSSMVTHIDSQLIHIASSAFFSKMVDAPRSYSDEEEDLSDDAPNHRFAQASSPPIAILFCHADELLSIVMQTFRLGILHLSVKESCLHFIRVCSALEPNVLPIVQSQGLSLVLKLLPEVLSSSASNYTVEDALESILNMAQFLDTYQRRRVVRVLATILRTQGDVNILKVTVVLLYTLLRSVAGRKKDAQIESLNCKKATSSPRAVRTLSCSPLIEHPDPVEDLMKSMEELCFPQILIHLSDFFCRTTSSAIHEEDSEEEEDSVSTEGQVRLWAERCLQEYLIPNAMGRLDLSG